MTQFSVRLGKTARLTALAGLAAGLLALPSASSLAQTSNEGGAVPADAPLPGYWKYSYRVWILQDDDMKCLSAKDVQKVATGLCNKSSKCTYSVNEARDGKLRVVGEWIDHKGRHTDISGTGVYAQKSFKLNAHVVLRHLLVPLGVDGTITGTWVSPDCPPGTGFKQ